MCVVDGGWHDGDDNYLCKVAVEVLFMDTGDVILNTA